MVGRFGTAATAAAALWLLASSACAQVPGLTKEEAKCESNSAKTLAKFVKSELTCISTCITTFRMTSGPYDGCFAPFTDPSTAICVNDPKKGKPKARASIVQKCDVAGKDSCPECYAASDCSTGEPFVGDTQGVISTLAHFIYCSEAISAVTPTQAEATCEDGVAKAYAKLWRAKTQCYAKCNQNLENGKIALGSCIPESVLIDPATQTCISNAAAKAVGAIDKVCANAGGNPACYVPTFNTGAKWVHTFEIDVDNTTAAVQCGSPSGAFL
jgi:hypothetical protein